MASHNVQKAHTPLSHVSGDIWGLICTHLQIRDMCNAIHVSKGWCSILNTGHNWSNLTKILTKEGGLSSAWCRAWELVHKRSMMTPKQYLTQLYIRRRRTTTNSWSTNDINILKEDLRECIYLGKEASSCENISSKRVECVKCWISAYTIAYVLVDVSMPRNIIHFLKEVELYFQDHIPIQSRPLVNIVRKCLVNAPIH